MKISTLKISCVFVIILFTLSCSKDKENKEIDSETTIVGKVKLYDLFSKENFVYDDIQIEVTDSRNQKETISVDTNGVYRIYNLKTGTTSLAFNKPGYGGIGSISIFNSSDMDTISQIVLLEDIPFSYTIKSIELDNNMLYWSGSIDYVTDEAYIVGIYFFFSKHPDVSCNKYEFEYLSGAFGTVESINSTISQGITFYNYELLNCGFNYGDTVYITSYIVNEIAMDVFWGIEYKHYTVDSLNFKNQSNIYSIVFDSN